MSHEMKIGMRVVDSPVGPGSITGFSERGYPQVNNVTVGWIELEDGVMFDPNGTAQAHKDKRDGATSPATTPESSRLEYVRALEAAMAGVDPATVPGLTIHQRTLLSGFAKPARQYKTHMPNIHVEGPVAFHDQACPVYHQDGESAILYLNNGVFYPSDRAYLDGWRMLRLRGRLEKWIFRMFFNSSQEDLR